MEAYELTGDAQKVNAVQMEIRRMMQCEAEENPDAGVCLDVLAEHVREKQKTPMELEATYGQHRNEHNTRKFCRDMESKSRKTCMGLALQIESEKSRGVTECESTCNSLINLMRHGIDFDFSVVTDLVKESLSNGKTHVSTGDIYMVCKATENLLTNIYCDVLTHDEWETREWSDVKPQMPQVEATYPSLPAFLPTVFNVVIHPCLQLEDVFEETQLDDEDAPCGGSPIFEETQLDDEDAPCGGFPSVQTLRHSSPTQLPPLSPQLPQPQQLPTCDQLKWHAADTLPAVGPAFYAAAKAADTLIVYSSDECAVAEDVLHKAKASLPKNGDIEKAVSAAKAIGRGEQPESFERHPLLNDEGEIAWQESLYTGDKLLAAGFRYLDTPTITCLRHEAVGDVQREWFQVLHVYDPDTAERAPEHAPQSAAAMATLCGARFEGEGKLKAPSNIMGESVTKQPGAKAMDGTMLVYGSHVQRRPLPETYMPFPGNWPSRYAPGGSQEDEIMSHVSDHCGALSELEAELVPGAAARRRSIAAEVDPDARWRVVEGDADCPAFLMSLTQSYCVGPHNDSGVALEGIAFTWESDEELPDGHEWRFVVAGCIHPLPRQRRQQCFVGVQGQGVYHGTLPTSDSEPHMAHSGCGSALVSKEKLVNLLYDAEHNVVDPELWPSTQQVASAYEHFHSAAEKDARAIAKAVVPIEALAKELRECLQQRTTAGQTQAGLSSKLAGVRQQLHALAGTPGKDEALGRLHQLEMDLSDVNAEQLQQSLDAVLMSTREQLDELMSTIEEHEAEMSMAGRLAPLSVFDEDAEDGTGSALGGENNSGSDVENESDGDSLPKTTDELLYAIGSNDFGLISGAEVPSNVAKWACDAFSSAGGNGLVHERGKGLPDGHYVIKVPHALPPWVGIAIPTFLVPCVSWVGIAIPTLGLSTPSPPFCTGTRALQRKRTDNSLPSPLDNAAHADGVDRHVALLRLVCRKEGLQGSADDVTAR